MNDARATATNDKPWFDRLAHDLRGPLTSLQTAAYLLRTDPGARICSTIRCRSAGS